MRMRIMYHINVARPAVAVVAVCALAVSTLGAQSLQYKAADGTRYLSLPDTGPVARARLEYQRVRSVENAIALGTAQASVRQFREAIETFSLALRRDPNDARLLRWRGHRYLSVREFELAAEDLDAAIGLDSTLYGAWYHRGIVHFASGRFGDAARAFARALPLAPDAGERAGSVDWLWMSLMRDGDTEEARALLDRRPDTPDAGNAYARRLRLYRGELGPAEVIGPGDTASVQRSTLSFGIGNWYLLRGDTSAAADWFRRAIDAGGWPGFGFIIAEAELAGRTRTGNELAQVMATSACVDGLPADRFVRRTVGVNLTWPAEVPDTGAIRAWRSQVAFLLSDAAPLVRARFAAAGGELGAADSVLRWSPRPERVRVTTLRSGRVRAHPLHGDRSARVTAAGLFAAAIDSSLRTGTSAFFWPSGLRGDSLVVDVSISASNLAGPPIGALRPGVQIPLFHLAVPEERPVSVIPGSRAPVYPHRARSNGGEATVVGRFIVDTTGRIVPGSFYDVWVSDAPRPRGSLGVFYKEFVSAVADAVPGMRFQPATIGGCPVRQLVQMPFVFKLQR
jgi:Flp pilus assembly protein TadD